MHANGFYKCSSVCQKVSSFLCFIRRSDNTDHFVKSEVSSPQDWSKPFILFSYQTYSIEQHLAFSWKPPATLQLMRENYSYTNIHHCAARKNTTQMPIYTYEHIYKYLTYNLHMMVSTFRKHILLSDGRVGHIQYCIGVWYLDIRYQVCYNTSTYINKCDLLF